MPDWFLAVGVALLAWVLGSALTPLILALVFPMLCRLRACSSEARPRALPATITICWRCWPSRALALLPVPSSLGAAAAAAGPVTTSSTTWWPQLKNFGVDIDTPTQIQGLDLKSFDGNVESGPKRSARRARRQLADPQSLVLVPVLVFYLLVEAEGVIAGAWNLVPLNSRASLARFLGECDTMLRQYLKGQLAVMGAMALIYSLGLMCTGLNLAWPIGVFTGLAVFIPYLGYTTGLVLALMSAAIQFTGWHGVAAVAVVYALGQVLESFVLTPRLVGERIGLSPLAVILALLVFGEVFGFVGARVPAGSALASSHCAAR